MGSRGRPTTGIDADTSLRVLMGSRTGHAGRFIRRTIGKDAKLVFIGPCIAKKNESEEVDEVDYLRADEEMKVIFGAL